jgi:hypothetical protein
MGLLSLNRYSSRVGLLALATSVLTLFVLLHFYPPQQLYLPPCAFHELTGFYCPGCGSARALHYLMKFEIVDALRCNILFVIFFPFFIYFMVRAIAEAFGLRKLPEIRMTPVRTRVLAGVIILWWLVRNLPFAIFHIPA